jgi:hypothetical protein
MPRSATRAETVRRYYASRTPEERREQTKDARLSYHVKKVVEAWPELRPEQVAKLRALLQPVGSGPGA